MIRPQRVDAGIDSPTEILSWSNHISNFSFSALRSLTALKAPMNAECFA